METRLIGPLCTLTPLQEKLLRSIPTKWDKRYLDLAFHVAGWSKDPSTKVGAVLAKNDRVLSLGFNGIPAGLDDEKYLADRETKIACVIHAEINAMRNSNITLSEFADCTLYTTSAPCSNCAATVVQFGIKRVVTPTIDKELAKRWNFHLSEQMFDDAKVQLIEIDREVV